MQRKYKLDLAVVALLLAAARTTFAFGLPVPLIAGDSAHLAGCVPEVGFSPRGGAMDLVIELIDATPPGEQIDVAAYEFTSRRMAQALHAALARGVRLRLAVDAQVNVGKRYSRAYDFVGVPGAEVRYEDRWPIFHEKVTIVGNAVEEGSMNYTDAGDSRNRENANLFRDCAAVAGHYHADFEYVWAQGTPLR
jgi:phosphatidylserine/phosphatidylglycerophosphate/cardiolipin synthase-like enzyme